MVICIRCRRDLEARGHTPDCTVARSGEAAATARALAASMRPAEQ